MSVQQQDADGVWRQAIPLPFYTSRFTIWWPFLIPAFKCVDCGVTFDTEQEYRDHYRSDHPDPREQPFGRVRHVTGKAEA